jgi:hypothetical protein
MNIRLARLLTSPSLALASSLVSVRCRFSFLLHFFYPPTHIFDNLSGCVVAQKLPDVLPTLI